MTKQIVVGEYTNSRWFLQMKSKEFETEAKDLIEFVLALVRKDGTLIDESDGQFTGGVYSEIYDSTDKVVEFVFEKGDIYQMIVYNKDGYLNSLNFK